VGVTAGASAPEVLVTEAVEALRRNGADVREVQVVDENVRFALPAELEQLAYERGITLPSRSVMRQSI
jgi:4-hydroxy-3-methylbut-2-enyl diphosphate reductase